MDSNKTASAWNKGKGKGEVELQKEEKGVEMLPTLEYLGFEIIHVSANAVVGKFIVSQRSAQPHGVLHGGVSAMIAESVGSMGAAVASGSNKKVAGVELSISHLQPAPIGTTVQVQATPVNVGRRIQVWEVRFFATKDSSPESNRKESTELRLVALSKVTVTILPSNTEVNASQMKSLPSKL